MDTGDMSMDTWTRTLEKQQRSKDLVSPWHGGWQLAKQSLVWGQLRKKKKITSISYFQALSLFILHCYTADSNSNVKSLNSNLVQYSEKHHHRQTYIELNSVSPPYFTFLSGNWKKGLIHSKCFESLIIVSKYLNKLLNLNYTIVHYKLCELFIFLSNLPFQNILPWIKYLCL